MIIEDVSLVVGGQMLRGFQEVNITRSAEQAAIGFGLKCTNPAWHPDAWQLRLGAAVELRASGDLIVKGYIDEYEADHGEAGVHEVRVSGRSKAADCIDCPPARHKTGRVEGKDLLGVAREFDEFGVGFSADVALKPIARVQRNPGESAFATIEREARKQGVLLVGQPDGSIRMTRAGQRRHAGAIAEGQPPIRKFSVRFAETDKRSPVIVKGQRALGADGKALRQEVEEYDPSVQRYRPIILFAEGDATERELKRRAQWQRLRAAGRGISVSVTVAAWRDADGELWEPGRLLAVDLPSERLSQDLAVSAVTFTQNHLGTVAVLTLVDPPALGGKTARGKSDKAYAVPESDLD